MKIRYVIVNVLLVAQAICHAEVTGPLSTLKNKWGKGSIVDFRKVAYENLPLLFDEGGTAAASGGCMTNWIAGSTMSWFIPIGWHRKLSEGRDWFGVYEADYEACGDRCSRALLIGGCIDAYKLIRHIDEAGTYRTDKFHHWTSRSRWCRVLLDGRVLQEEHP